MPWTIVKDLRELETKRMDFGLIFQLIASTTAMLFSGSSLAFWLLYTNALNQTKRNKNRLIYSQIIIGGIIILGSIAFMVLTLKTTEQYLNH